MVAKVCVKMLHFCLLTLFSWQKLLWGAVKSCHTFTVSVVADLKLSHPVLCMISAATVLGCHHPLWCSYCTIWCLRASFRKNHFWACNVLSSRFLQRNHSSTIFLHSCNLTTNARTSLFNTWCDFFYHCSQLPLSSLETIKLLDLLKSGA